MGIISLQNPQIGQPDTTEDVKVQNNFTTLQTVINGNIDTNNLNSAAAVKDSQLASPNNAAKRLLFTQYYPVQGGQPYASGAWVWSQYGGGTFTASGASGGSAAPQLWVPDTSLAVPGKTTTGVIRMVTVSNGVAPSVTLNASITPITSLAGTANALTINFSAPTLPFVSLAISAGSAQSADSSTFTLPTSANTWMPVFAFTGATPVATNAFIGAWVSLYVFSV